MKTQAASLPALPALQRGNNDTETVALAPSNVAFQLLSTWQRKKVLGCHHKSTYKNKILRLTFPSPHSGYELLGSER